MASSPKALFSTLLTSFGNSVSGDMWPHHRSYRNCMHTMMTRLGTSMQTACNVFWQQRRSAQQLCQTCIWRHDAAPLVQCFQTTSPMRGPPLETPLAPSICLLACCLMVLWLAAQILHVCQTASHAETWSYAALLHNHQSGEPASKLCCQRQVEPEGLACTYSQHPLSLMTGKCSWTVQSSRCLQDNAHATSQHTKPTLATWLSNPCMTCEDSFADVALPACASGCWLGGSFAGSVSAIACSSRCVQCLRHQQFARAAHLQPARQRT